MEHKKTINYRLKMGKNIQAYLSKIKKDIDITKDSVCIRKNKKGDRVLINIRKKKPYFRVSERLGKSDEIVEHESYFGEVYKLYFPPNIKKSDIKVKNTLAAKVIPLTDDDMKYQYDILSESWKELIIQQQITKNILYKKLSPNFSLFYGYFVCKDGNIQDFSNVNIINKMKIRDLIKKLKKYYAIMSNIITEFDATNRTAIDIINNLSVKIRTLGIELERYEYNVRYPNPRFNLIILMELESTTLTKVLVPLIKPKLYAHNIIRIFHRLRLAEKIKNPFFYNEVSTQLTKKKIDVNKLNTLKKNQKNTSLAGLFDGVYIDRVFCYSMIFQIISAINNLSRLGIAHLDLHIENVLIAKSKIIHEETWDKFGFFKYKINDKLYYVPDYGMTCKIGDFGLSETLSSFNKRNKAEKYDFATFIVDKLAYFVFTQQDERRIDNLSNNIINNIATQNPKIVFEYLGLFDVIIIMISLIAEIEHISKNVFLEIQKMTGSVNILQLHDKFLIIPEYLGTLKLLQSSLLNIFLCNLGKKGKLKQMPKKEYFTAVSNIIEIFQEDNITIDENDVILNKVPFYG